MAKAGGGPGSNPMTAEPGDVPAAGDGGSGNLQAARWNAKPAVPWSVRDTWIGVLILVVLIGGIAAASVLLPRGEQTTSILLVLTEPLLLVPVAVILGWKRIGWSHLGFRKFAWQGPALGCGALLLIYPLILLHNFILTWAGVETQGSSITELYHLLDTPAPFLISAVLIAPLSEEIFFRGFLFQGLRQKHGWVAAMLISSAVFAAFHLQPAALIPTFLLGCVLAFIYQMSDSIWPGMLLHLFINGCALGVTALGVRMGWF